MINGCFRHLISMLKTDGDEITTRGAKVKSIFGYNFGPVSFFPIITVRKTAWKTALQEMEWFMSGNETCPEGVLRDIWWKGQLDPDNKLKGGYPTQLRRSACPDGHFDQVQWLREEIKTHPTSRRLLLTVWNPGTMAFFTDINKNLMTPTSCHLITNQFQVRDGRLHMNAQFRSTDVLLGLPHNLVQHRALQLYFAYYAGVEAAPYYNLYLNDVHYYDHPEHLAFVDWLTAKEQAEVCSNHDMAINNFVYTPPPCTEGTREFKAEDFSVRHKLPEPSYTQRITRTL